MLKYFWTIKFSLEIHQGGGGRRGSPCSHPLNDLSLCKRFYKSTVTCMIWLAHLGGYRSDHFVEKSELAQLLVEPLATVLHTSFQQLHNRHTHTYTTCTYTVQCSIQRPGIPNSNSVIPRQALLTLYYIHIHCTCTCTL